MKKNTLHLFQVAVVILIFTYPVYLLARMLLTRQITGFDDAYMFARYAMHWNEGNGLMVWNIGEPPIYGPTSLPYVLVVGLFLRVISLEPGLVLPLTSWVMGLFMLLVLLGISRTLVHEWASIPTLIVVVFILWIVLEPAFAYHSLSGMDTTFSALGIAALTWSSILLYQRASIRRMFFATLFAILCYFIRPDNILYAFFLPFLALMLGTGSSKRLALAFVVAFISLVLIDLAIKKYWLGDIFPLSHYVKQSGGQVDYVAVEKWNPIIYLTAFTFSLLPGLLILSMYVRRRHRAMLAILFLPLFLTFLYYFRVTQIMGGYARFYYPSLPVIFASAIFVLSDTYADDPLRLRPGKIELRKAIVALLLFLGLSALGLMTYSESVWTAHPSLSRMNQLSKVRLPELGWDRAMRQMGALAREFPPGTVVVASEVGYLGANIPGLTLIDITGLNDTRIAHQGFSSQALLARKPDFIWLPPGDYPRTQYSLLCNTDFQQSYTYFPDAYKYGIAIRNDSPFAMDILSALRRNWQHTYPEIDISGGTAKIEALQVMCR